MFMKNKWLLWFVMYFSALCVSLSQFKIATIIGNLVGTMGLSNPANIAYLMSVFAIAGIILAIPGGAILGKLGPKKLLMCLMVSLLLGNLIGAFAINSFQLMLVSRILEGVAFSMIIMVGVVLISEWFAGTKIVGTAIGLFCTFPAVASGIMLNVSTPIANAIGMQSLWFIVGAFVLIALIMVAAIIPGQKSAPDQSGGAPEEAEKASIGESIANSKVWLMAVCQGCVAFILFTFLQLYPYIFTVFYGLPESTANFYGSLAGWFGLPFSIVSGVIIDKFKNAPLLILIAFIFVAVGCFTTSLLGTATYILHTLIISIFTGIIISAVLIVVPTVAKRPALIGYSVAFVNTIYFIGIFAGPALFTNQVENVGPQAGTNVLTIAALLGVVASVIFMLVNRKKKSA